MPSLLRLRIVMITWVLLGASGCVTAPASTAAVHVQVSASGAISCHGKPCSAEQLPSCLARMGAKKTQEIRVHLEDSHNKRLIAKIYNGLHSQGYAHILFVDEPRAVSEIIGEPNSRTEAPAGNSTTRPPTQAR